jgi:hypothetical protein
VTDPFQQGYLAAPASRTIGRVLIAPCCPHSPQSLAWQQWHAGLVEYVLDRQWRPSRRDDPAHV